MDTIGTVHMLRTNQLIPNPDNTWDHLNPELKEISTFWIE